MKRKLRNLLIIISIFGIIYGFLGIINNFIILTNIHYKISYKVNIQNSESIIEKSESFEYQKYCKYRDYWDGKVYNVSNSDSYYHIDRVFIESLKLKVKKDRKSFHIFPFHFYGFYWHKLTYSLEVIDVSLIYLTYNNNSIFKAEYANHTEIFEAFYSYTENNSLLWDGNWYLNFTLIPFASNMSSTIVLKNIFLVKMSLDYDYFFRWLLFGMVSEVVTIEQYLCFNSNYQIIFVYFPLASITHYI